MSNRSNVLLAVLSIVAVASLACGRPPSEGKPSTPSTREDAGTLPSPCEPNPCQELGRGACIAGDATFVCVCDPGFVLEGDACVVPEVVCAPHMGDVFEPDECADTARRVPASGLFEEAHTLGVVDGDVDWFQIEAAAGESWRIDVTAPGFAVGVDVFADPSQAPIASHRSGLPVTQSFLAPVDGSYFVRLSAVGAKATGAYVVSIVNDGPDEHPAAPQGHELLVVDHSKSGPLQFAGDRDAVRFMTPPRRSVRLTATWSDGRSASLKLRAFEAGMEIASDVGAPAELELWYPDARELVLEVSSPESTTGAWTLTATDLGVDDHANGLLFATRLTGSTGPNPGAFEREGDGDVFAFQANVGHVYRFTCRTYFASDVCSVSLHDASGIVAFDDGASAEVIFEAAQPGDHWVRLEGSGSFGYAWTFDDLGAEDHGDNAAHASPLSVPTLALPARFEHRSDTDAFAFSGKVGQLYRATCVRADGGACVLSFVDPSGFTVDVAEAAGSTSLTISLNDPSVHGLLARVPALSFAGDYELTLEHLGPDDHANTFHRATQIGTTTAPAPAQFEANSDRDWFVFKARAGMAWSFTCGQHPRCRVAISDALGTVLSSGVGAAAVQPQVDEPLFVEVRPGSSQRGPSTYTYQLLTATDDHGDSETTATAITAQPSFSAVGVIGSPGDRDVFALEPVYGSTYDLTCSPSGMSDCTVRVRNSLGQQLAYVTSSVIAVVRFKARLSSDYFIEVSSSQPTNSGSYSLELVEFAPDDHGDNPQVATALGGLGVPMDGALEMTGDYDFFSITLAPGSAHTAVAKGMSTDLQLIDDQWNILGSGNGSVSFTAPQSGPVYVRVRWGGGGTSTTGTYTLTVQ